VACQNFLTSGDLSSALQAQPSFEPISSPGILDPVLAAIEIFEQAGTLQGQHVLNPEIGEAGEAVVDGLMLAQGYELVDGVSGQGDHGIDRLYIQPETGKLVVVEVKATVTGSGFRPGKADHHRQGSTEYVANALDAAGYKALAEEARDSRGKSEHLESIGFHVNLSTRSAQRMTVTPDGRWSKTGGPVRFTDIPFDPAAHVAPREGKGRHE